MSDPRTRFQADLFRDSTPPKEKSHAPFQVSSATSREAAQKMTEGPAFHGNRLACLREIAKSDPHGGTTRKAIAAALFANQQQYVTGPVRVLIDEGLVYEEPAYGRDGFIMRRGERVVHKKVDGSAVLRLTNKGRAVAA